jgi:hypothetical protein
MNLQMHASESPKKMYEKTFDSILIRKISIMKCKRSPSAGQKPSTACKYA